jgi:GNAT superfamily N-acetyltransferase/8-oxo-dGTP pyrophosphatase MutT (NUDIX family)
VEIRRATPQDADAIWDIFRRVVAERDAYAFAPQTPREEGVGYWFGDAVTSFVIEADGGVAGMYKLIANRRDLGSHVANASFMVHPERAGRGLGRAMGEHCLREARIHGYDAIQFNFVVSTNHAAVALWQRLGFHIIGTLPRAFRHGKLGLVDAYVMHRFLDDIVPTFGAERLVGDAAVRTCAYAIVTAPSQPDGGGNRDIALVRSHGDILLPGGGLDDGEESAAALIREVAEECALSVAVADTLGEAIQIVGGRDGRPAVKKHSTFFAARIEGPLDQRAEHEVVWLPAEMAERATTNESHAWAIRRWARLNT